ncbi:uncharacterized protein LODBEIA_P40570 [Lodderomyces beijingensis]|uniref:LicD/FKTN/FKRP nucleotidyltransferase domain-containing protein n=1 Tax=Lodderomyces beijingensis TaxID=1775926 RepID=A0ABP0ZNV8_9ASCO
MLKVANIGVTKPSKLLRYLFFTVVVINLTYIILTEYDLKSSFKAIVGKSYLNLKSTQDSLSVDDLNIRPISKQLSKKIDLLTQPENQRRFFMINSDLTEVDITVHRNHTQERAKSNLIYYDPRFTLSVYLHELKIQYLAHGRTVDLNKLDTPITLPFNWYDWIDLTILNENIRMPPEARPNCQSIRELTESQQVFMEQWCQNLDSVSQQDLQNWGYTREQLPGYIFFGHQPHNRRSFNDQRVLMSKSYAMIHLPNPLKVIILDEFGTYEFDVDQNNRNRIEKGRMWQRYLNINRIGEDVPEVTLNHINELRHLQSMIIPYSRAKTGLDMTLTQYNLSESSFHPVPIAEHMLSFPKEFRRSDLPEAEKMKLLTPQERVFYQGLVDCSQHLNNVEPRYFKMATIRIDDPKNVDYDRGWHYDWRFFNGALNYAKDGWNQQENIYRTQIILDRLLRNWAKFAQTKGIVWWIMHGPLLSWYWNGLMFPFDVDIDIQMPVSDLYKLAKSYNQTLVVEDPTEGYGKYLIDVGTYIYNRDMSRGDNYIDARFIDVDSGIYIDITGLSKSKAMPKDSLTEEELQNLELIQLNKQSEEDEIYNDRRKHFYKLDQLSPLKYSMLQGIPVFVPSEVNSRLQFEYSKGLSDYEYAKWYYVKQINLWVHRDHLVSVLPASAIQPSPDGKTSEKDLILLQLDLLTDDHILKLLEIDEILIEYYKTKKFTDLHDLEMEYMLIGDNAKYHKLVDQYFKKIENKPLRKALWDYEHLERSKYHRNR